MFPLKDDNPTEIFPFFTLGIVFLCVASWVFIQGAGLDQRTLVDSVCTLGSIPTELGGSVEGVVPLAPGVGCRLGGFTWSTLLTSMFLHGSWMHLIGNMWFLWIFGNNIEDSMGHWRFLVFYLLTGLAAAGAHVLSDPSSTVPTVGASGAISGVMGAYLVLYPRARVLTAVIFVFFIRLVLLPAWVMLGYWFVIQLISGVSIDSGRGGVAFWAHVGGFLAGLALIRPFESPRLADARRAHV